MTKAVLNKNSDQVFSVSFSSIVTDQKLLFDLYTNFSEDGSSSKFMKIFPIGELLGKEDLESFRIKYAGLYVLEEHRQNYLRSLVRGRDITEEVKSEIIKTSAIEYLDDLFQPTKQFSTDLLSDSIRRCHDAVSVMVDLVQDYTIDSLQSHIGKLSFHDFYTYDHSVNVSMYCISFYKFLHPEANNLELSLAGLGGMLHDLGKIRIPTSIINNPGKLSDKEFAEIRKHPWFGRELLCEGGVHAPKGLDLEILKRIVFEHHEHFDGTGYPEGLHAENIHVMARMTAICDFFDAITTKRAYSAALSIEDALAIMGRTAGAKLDPELFKQFLLHCGDTKPALNPISTIDPNFDPCQPRRGLPLRGHRH